MLPTPGSLDTTFGSGGGVVVSIPGGAATAVAVHADGFVIVGGTAVGPSGVPTAVIARLDHYGRVDASFGTGGVVRLDRAGGYRCACLVCEQDGLLVGVTSERAPRYGAIVRLTTSGELDTAFGQDGVIRPFLDADHSPFIVSCLAIQADGRIIAGGFSLSRSRGNLGDFALARFHDNGTPDPSFGSRGVLTTDVAGRHQSVTTVLIDAHGRVVAVGSVSDERSTNPALVRYTAAGELDIGFGRRGIVLGGYGGTSDHALAGALLPSGHILVGGMRIADGSEHPAVAAFNADGSPDRTYGTDGIVVDALAGLKGLVSALLAEPDGRVLVAGRMASAQATGVALARLDEAGRRDTSFGIGGIAVTKLKGSGGLASALIRDPGGRLIVAANSGGGDGLVVLGYANPPVPARPAAGARDKSSADIQADQAALMQRIQQEHQLAMAMNRNLV